MTEPKDEIYVGQQS